MLPSIQVCLERRNMRVLRWRRGRRGGGGGVGEEVGEG